MALQLPASGDARHWTGFVEPEAGVSLPCTRIRGARPGKRVLISAGIHGGEYSSIEAARRLTQLSPDEIAGELVLLPVVSIEAFWRHLAFLSPLDWKNLNRVFPGKADGTPSERRAAWLSAAMAGMDGYIDLHCGDMTETLIPFAVFPGEARSREMALASGFPYAVESGSPGHSYSAAVAQGVPGLILESGGNGLWTEESVGLLLSGVRRILAHLGMLTGPAPAVAAPPTVCRMAGTAAPVAGFWHPAVKLGDSVAPNGVIGVIHDLAGPGKREIRTEQGGRVLYHSTSLAISQGEALVGIGVGLA
jgi:uncharacterized protein